MDPLNELIDSCRGYFDTDEPPEGHFARFESKLPPVRKATGIKAETLVFRIAAVLIVGLFLSALFIKGLDFFRQGREDSCINQELCEAEDYYSSQVEYYYKQIRTLPFNNDTQTRREIMEELKEMDYQVAGMKEDLRQNPDDERIIHTIINYYQEKIDFMNMIIIRTTESKTTVL